MILHTRLPCFDAANGLPLSSICGQVGRLPEWSTFGVQPGQAGFLLCPQGFDQSGVNGSVKEASLVS
jgi:hypothetical protein